MELNKADLLGYVYDPTRIQREVLEFVDKANNNELTISNATNPFTMLLEAAAVSAANAATESHSIIRKKYPSLATTPEELLHHVSDVELQNMFAIPANGYFTFYVNIIDLKNMGYRPQDAKYVETIIPKHTEIEILNIKFTLLNNISVRLYDEGAILVEQMYNDDEISVNDLGILQYVIQTDASGVSWIVFETILKQVKRTLTTHTIVTSDGFKKNTAITDSYYHANVYYKNSATNNLNVKLNKYHNEDYIDPDLMSVYININNKNILYKIPDVYIADGKVSGVVTIETFETKGKLYLPINKYKLEDFKITYGPTTESIAASTVINIAILGNSREVVDGGSDSITLENLRKSIIKNTTGEIDTPITFDGIARMSSFNGFEVFKVSDILTERLYAASKTLPELDTSLVYARQDVFFNTVKLELNSLESNKNIYAEDDVFVLKSGTVFREENNVVSVVSNQHMESLNLLSNLERVQYYKGKRYFFTPYYYVIDRKDGNTKNRVYDLDNPKIDNLKILGKNTNVVQRCNIDKFTMVKNETGYRLYFTLISNVEFQLLDQTLIEAQLTLPLAGNSTYAYIKGTYDQDTKYLVFDLDTNLYVNEDNYISIENGLSTIYNKLVNLVTKATVHIYTLDNSVKDDKSYLVSDIVVNRNTKVVLSKESIDITLGKELKYLWNRMFTTYSERKYLKREFDLPLYHQEDVYDSTNPLSCDGAGEIQYNILHRKGDPVLDENNEQVFVYRKGDPIMDANGLPQIDAVNGIIRYCDIFMLDYTYKLATTSVYQTYMSTTMDVINNWLHNSLADINNKVLENTAVLFKSYKSTKNINIMINNVPHVIPYVVYPEVVLYSTRHVYTATELEEIRITVGKLLHKYLDQPVIKLNLVKDEIMSTISNEIVGVKITGLDNAGNLEAITIKDKTSRLVLAKKLDINKSNELVVKYDLNIMIQSI